MTDDIARKVINLSPSIRMQLEILAARFSLDRLILFGSRAKGTHHDRSDIDIATRFVSPSQYFDFCDAVEEIPTLLSFDIIDLNSDTISLNLKKSIMEEGILLYEKV